jgi:hypothetical protein
VKTLGREGVDSGMLFCIWKDDNLKVGFKDNKFSQKSLIVPGISGPAHERLDGELKKLTQARKDWSTLSYEDVVKSVGKPGEKYDVKRYVWKNSKNAVITVDFKDGKAIEKQAMGFPLE